jgi:hypothetical protein
MIVQKARLTVNAALRQAEPRTAEPLGIVLLGRMEVKTTKEGASASGNSKRMRRFRVLPFQEREIAVLPSVLPTRTMCATAEAKCGAQVVVGPFSA